MHVRSRSHRTGSRRAMRAGGAATAALLLAMVPPAGAQALPPGGARFTPPPPTPNDTLVSPDVGADGRITLRLYAPMAKSVSVTGEFIPFGAPPLALTRQADGVWTGITGPIQPGAYRYAFVMDRVSIVDPKNRLTSTSARQVQSLVVVSKDDVAADRPGVPHGAVAEVLYASPRLAIERRMHVYTPPGYGRDGRTYPVLYLLHGGGDSDDSWPTVGRAGIILDNLIASGQALPMVVVMPDGSVQPSGQPMTADERQDPFTTDLKTAIMPFVEANYRVSKRPEDTALAGLSMGGIQTLNIGLTSTDRFRWIGVFSSGWFPNDLAAFEQRHGSELEADTRRLRLFYYTNGSDDIALPNAKNVYAMLDRHHARYEAHETPGGHTWINWRRNLSQFAPRLFRPAK